MVNRFDSCNGTKCLDDCDSLCADLFSFEEKSGMLGVSDITSFMSEHFPILADVIPE